MGDTKIEWADKTWSPVTGCSHSGSPGCDNCFAKRMSLRLVGRYGYPRDDPFKVTLHPDRLNDPLKWKKPVRIFVCSMSDLFHPEVPFSFLDEVWEIMGRCHQQTFQILTKRPERMAGYLASEPRYRKITSRMPHPNVWLGVTVEDQQRADERIPILLQIPAAKRFVSYEPALGAVDFSPYFRCRGCGYTAKDKFEQMDHLLCKNPTGTLDQIIAGEETGPHARRPKPEWFSDVIRQCRSAGVPIFIKKAPEGVEIIREFPK